MIAGEEAWQRLEMTPRTVEDLDEVAGAAVSLLPPRIVPSRPELTATFRWTSAWYTNEAPVTFRGELEAGPSEFCLAPDMVHLTPQRIFQPGISAHVGQLLRSINQTWHAPEHDLVRALVGAHTCARYSWPISHVPAEGHMAACCQSLNANLCRVAAAWLEGPARAVASASPSPGPRAPLELMATARAVVQEPAPADKPEHTGPLQGQAPRGESDCGTVGVEDIARRPGRRTLPSAMKSRTAHGQ